jgi:hypothetical protein
VSQSASRNNELTHCKSLKTEENKKLVNVEFRDTSGSVFTDEDLKVDRRNVGDDCTMF